MKRIINGKMYNTETAKALGTAHSNAPVNSFEYWEETLYKKRQVNISYMVGAMRQASMQNVST